MRHEQQACINTETHPVKQAAQHVLKKKMHSLPILRFEQLHELQHPAAATVFDSSPSSLAAALYDGGGEDEGGAYSDIVGGWW